MGQKRQLKVTTIFLYSSSGFERDKYDLNQLGKSIQIDPDLIKITIIKTPASHIRGRLKLLMHCIQLTVIIREKSNTMLGSINKNSMLKMQLIHYG